MIWKLYYKKLGGHVHCRLFCGPTRGALGKCGDIVFRDNEFTEFTQIHKTLPIVFVRETDMDGVPLGDSDVKFYREWGRI